MKTIISSIILISVVLTSNLAAASDNDSVYLQITHRKKYRERAFTFWQVIGKDSVMERTFIVEFNRKKQLKSIWRTAESERANFSLCKDGIIVKREYSKSPGYNSEFFLVPRFSEYDIIIERDFSKMSNQEKLEVLNSKATSAY